MAFNRPSVVKRQKEQGRKDKQKEKAERRAQRQAEKKNENHADGVDPDIAGIVPGPQPRLDADGEPVRDADDDPGDADPQR